MNATGNAGGGALAEALREVLARDAVGGATCRCSYHSRVAEQEYESGTCPHQRAVALLSALVGAAPATPDELRASASFPEEVEALAAPAKEGEDRVSGKHIENLMEFARNAPRTYRDTPEPPPFDFSATPAAPKGGEDSREAFERWVSQRHGCATDRWADTGKYRYDNTNAWWECWQAAQMQPATPAGGGGEEPTYGIIDPDYARVFTIARCLAWAEGYALAMHGSFSRDLDLVAVPWTDAACEPEHLARRIEDAAGLRITTPGKEGEKPHGRLVWTLKFKTFGDPRFIDLSITPRRLSSGGDLAPSAWRPIESAPKDGSLFLCWVSAERWSQEDGGGSGRGADTSDVDFCQWRDNNGNGYFMNMMGQLGDVQAITHWQPLPAAPTQEQQG